MKRDSDQEKLDPGKKSKNELSKAKQKRKAEALRSNIRRRKAATKKQSDSPALCNGSPADQ